MFGEGARGDEIIESRCIGGNLRICFARGSGGKFIGSRSNSGRLRSYLARGQVEAKSLEVEAFQEV